MGQFFLRSDNTLTNSGKTLYTPTWSTDMHSVPVVVVRVSKVGKSIEECFADRYYQELAIGNSFVDVRYHREVLALGLDPSLAYDFDGSLVISDFVPKEEFPDTVTHLVLNNGAEESQKEQLDLRRIPLEQIHQSISVLSRYYLLKMGDCITFPLANELRRIKLPEQHLYTIPHNNHVILHATVR